MVKVLISGYYGYKNFGDEAILSVLSRHLKDNGAEVTVLSGDVEYSKSKDNVNAVNRFDISSVIKSIMSTDVLISGGGSLLQDVTSLKSLVYYCFIIALAIFYNKKVIIFAQGIGPINNAFAQKIVKMLLKKCDYVSVRDEKSLNLLRNWGINANLVCDPVYSIDVASSNRNGVGIQLRDFNTMNLNLLQKLGLLVNSKFSDRNIKIFSLQKSQDYELCKRFEDILKTLNPNINTQIIEDDIINNISTLEYFIGMRFHSLLVALKACVKTCAIDYDIKVDTLAKEAGLPVVSMDASENFEEIYNKLINLDTKKLLEYGNSKQFDWTLLDKFLLT